jgi:NADH dehydrogenase
VALAVVESLRNNATAGQLFELGGPEVITFRQVLERILHHCGRKRLLVPVPFGVARFKAFFLQLFPSPLLTVDQVKLLEHDNVVSFKARSSKHTLEGLGIDPVLIDAVVPEYLERFRAYGEFAAFRR